jgi:putative membrane protein
MMGHWYGSMSAGDWILMTVFWVALIAFLVWAISGLLGRNETRGGDATGRPEEILDRRLASGEIDAATYEALRGTLREAHAGKV